MPAGEAWLAPSERAVLAGLRVEKRARDWRLGRWVAKTAATRALGEGVEVAILADEEGRPTARVAGRSAADLPCVSLSHSRDLGFAAAWCGAGQVGCDVEAVEPRSEAFVDSYFTETERARMAGSDLRPDVIRNLLWSAKESALKALGEGLRSDTRRVEVTGVGWPSRPGRWAALDVAGPGEARFEGAWRELDGFVWTVLVGPVKDGARRASGAGGRRPMAVDQEPGSRPTFR
ncbi:MAG: 4'-phosphopantetheinyl transferase superfamily protein [Gemmatimonadota bacterium]